MKIHAATVRDNSVEHAVNDAVKLAQEWLDGHPSAVISHFAAMPLYDPHEQNYCVTLFVLADR